MAGVRCGMGVEVFDLVVFGGVWKGAMSVVGGRLWGLVGGGVEV